MTHEPGASALSRAWRELLDHPLLIGLILLLPAVFLMPPLPIDETRYLAVAWEMRQSGEFLVPHLNGAAYAHKPPLLFWLINAGWLLTGVHAWTARAVTLLCSALSLLLLYRLTLRLTASATTARFAMWILLGAMYFAAFANAIMFDVLLTTCVLLAVHGVCDLADGHASRGIVITGGAIGLGILVKGPVMLLDVAFVALLAPWWHVDALRGRTWRYFGALGVAVLTGAAIGLAWAIPAAMHGGADYAHAIFLKQTMDRIEGTTGASTHSRPWWWYAMIFPMMVLPWPLVLRGGWRATRALLGTPSMRLVLAWLVPTFIVFSMIGGKQPHYLLPVLPALALAAGIMLEQGVWRVRSGLFAVLIVAFGVGLTMLPRYAATHPGLQVTEAVSPWWGVMVISTGVLLFALARRIRDPAWPALATLALVMAVKFAVVQGTGQRYDPQLIAEAVRAAQQRGQPIVHMGWHHGVYEFAARLQEPLETLGTMDDLQAWAVKHPDGLVISYYPRFRFRAPPVFTEPFRGVEVSIWNVHEALASGVDADVAHSRDDIEDASDD